LGRKYYIEIEAGKTPITDLMSPIVKVFRRRPHANDAAHSGGRRRKTSKGGNRGKGYADAFYTEVRGPESG